MVYFFKAIRAKFMGGTMRLTHAIVTVLAATAGLITAQAADLGLTPDQNVNLTTADNQTVTLASVFTGKYLLFEFSSAT